MWVKVQADIQNIHRKTVKLLRFDQKDQYCKDQCDEGIGGKPKDLEGSLSVVEIVNWKQIRI